MNALKNIRNIDYTVLFARDMKKMRRFYEDVMGFPGAHGARRDVQ